MNSFQIYGGKVLKGSIQPQGAKNEVLQILCCCLLTEHPIEVRNVPDIIDIKVLLDVLERMDVSVEKKEKNTFLIQAKKINTKYLASKYFIKECKKLRASVMLAGPLVARLGESKLATPGGDKIGRRKLDAHLNGFIKQGIKVRYNTASKSYILSAKHIKPAYILLEEPSVTGTANLLFTSVFAKGTTTLFNAACEPYLCQLCHLLNQMGAKISGIGSNRLTIEGVTSLKGKGIVHTVLPDMIEVGSFIGLAAITQSHIRIKNCGISHLGIIPDKFRSLGIKLRIEGDDIIVPAQKKYEVINDRSGGIPTFYDHPWPGFTPDLISIILVVAIQAKGSILIHQKMFESRLFFVDKLIEMGAKIILCDPHRATVIGLERKQKLRGITMTSPDIRAGVALLLAALSAEGKSIIQHVEQIDRGYENIETRLQALGADIKRISF